MSRKGQAGNLLPLIVLVVLSILVLIFGSAIGGKTYQTVEADLDAIGNNLVQANSLTLTNVTLNDLGHSFVQTGTLVFYNSTGDTLALSNFTIDYDAGTAQLLTGSYNGTTWLVNYTWGAKEIRESTKNGIAASFGAIEDTGELMPLVVLAVIIGIVIVSVVGLAVVAGGRNNGGGAAL